MEPELPLFGLIVALFVGSPLVARWVRPEVVGLSFLAVGLVVYLILCDERFASSRAVDYILIVIMPPLILPGLILVALGRAIRGPMLPSPKPGCRLELPAAPPAWRRRARIVGLILWTVAMILALGKLGFGLYRNRDLFWQFR